MHPLKSDAPLIVYIDIKSPFAFVAIGPTLALEAEFGLQFDWRPLTLDIPSFLGSAEKRDGKVVASKGRSDKTWVALRHSYMDARRYAERQGLMLKGTEKIWDSRIAHVAILWAASTARAQLPEFLKALYHPFWRRELDIENIDVVLRCLNDCAIDTSGFLTYLAGEGGRLHDELQLQFHTHGIYGVPSYVFDDEILFGREHLPYIRWHLRGKRGPAPDIAYEVASC